MSYKIITRPDAVTWFSSLANNKQFNVKITDSSSHLVLSDKPDELISQISEAMLRIKNDVSQKSTQGSDKVSLEYEVGKILFDKLINVNHVILTDSSFWRWLTIAHPELLSVAAWRHDKNPGAIHEMQKVNLGIGNIREGFYSRSWMRVYLSYDENAKDPYGLACRGDQDFWRSHVLRQSYAKSPAMVRALIRFQYPEINGVAKLKPSGDSATGIRRLARNLSASLATIAIDAFDEDDAYDFIESIHQKMLLAEQIEGSV
jgi:hypothetical protein